jgi:hypothetical protein
MRRATGLGLFLAFLFASQAFAVEHGICRFDPAQLKFAGTAKDQARCLLRPVKKDAILDPILTALPAPLDTLIGTQVAVTKQRLRAYLSAQGIQEAAVGGSLDNPVSRANDNKSTAPLARYFVIHDTSTPNCSKVSQCAELGKLPSNRDDTSWEYNDAKLILKNEAGDPVAHVFVARTGVSRTPHDFEVPWRATRLETESVGIPSKGLFIHVENVQPRIAEPAIPASQKKVNDKIAPNPGFTAAQYKRLALVYLAASVRRGEWLIPGFHAVIDEGISSGHDDPQNFDLGAWTGALKQILDEIP